MWLEISLLISVLLQFVTAFIAISLIKRTRTNIAWWLISAGFLIMAVRRLIEFLQLSPENEQAGSLFNSWLGVLVSVIMLLSLAFIKRIFNIQKRLEKIKTENQKRILTTIINTEEDQKQKFAKELHDGLGPLLSSIKIAVSAVAQKENSQETGKILKNTDLLIEESIKTLKDISNNMSPHVLNNYGLHKAVRSFVNRMPETKFNFHFHSDDKDKRYTKIIETVCYRVICELITNSIKHSEAKDIFVNIYDDNNKLIIVFEDNGKGFDINNKEIYNRGLGLNNILSRVNSVNGSCILNSESGKGFKAEISILI